MSQFFILNIRYLCFTILLCLTTACGGGGGGDKRNVMIPYPGAVANPPADGIFRPATTDSPYFDDLVACINIETIAQACRLSRLPFIGQETTTPTKADIMARTIVSHPWMASRFSQLLDQMPADIYQLFQGVTGIAIGAEIRPSYYWAASGAIYLDPADLWVTDAERRTISVAPDYRSEFGRELAFNSLWRYVEGNHYAWDSYPLDGTVNHRPLQAVIKPMAALLFHELAHANDFAPPALIASSDSTNTPLEQIIEFDAASVSVELDARSPLSSDLLYGLADVMFHGEPATPFQKQLTAEDVGLAFATDGASDPYAYASFYEDTAMLFEEVMMKHHFNLDRDLAFTDAPFTANAYCEDYVVRWGQRNRIGDPLVKSRAEIVVQQLLNRTDIAPYFANIPAPRAMTNGRDWCANIDFNRSNHGMQKPHRQKVRAGDFARPVLH